MPSTTKPKSYLSIVEGHIENEPEPFDDTNVSSRRKARFLVGMLWVLVVLVGYNKKMSSSQDSSMQQQQQQGLMMLAEIMNMAPPPPQDIDVDLEGAAPAWAECKTKGAQIASECTELNPVDPEGCKDRGKEAAKACYKEMAKQYKNYWKNYGKEMKEKGKAQKVSKGDDDESSSSSSDGSTSD